MQRAQRVQMRDSRRALLYLRWWIRACEQAEACVAEYQASAWADRIVEDLPDPFEVIRSLADRWAVVLDDFVAPIVSLELVKIAVTTPNSSDPSLQRQLYDNLFLDPHAGGGGGGGGLTPWCRGLPQAYPFLFDLMRSYLDNSVNNLRLCLQRLRHDRQDLLQFLGNAPGPVLRVQSTGSDGHCGGQGVLILHLTSGTRVVYKPFGGEPAQLAAELLTLLGSAVSSGQQHVERLLPSVPVCVSEQEASATGNKYHWAAYVAAAPCTSKQEVVQFYTRAGALTAAATLLGFSDGHHENLLACGATPLIVDCETFFQPSTRDEPYGITRVLQTQLVQSEPKAFSAADGDWRAAFQHPPTATTATHSFAVRGERTCFMSVAYDMAEGMQRSEAVPCLEGAPQLLKDYVASFEEGFRATCKAAQELAATNADQLSACLKRAEACVVRVVPRPTSVYIRCLRLLQQPSVLHSRQDAEMALRKALDQQQQGSALLQALVPSELDDLLAFDVPAFFTPCSDPSAWRDSRGRVLTLPETLLPWTPAPLMDGSAAQALLEGLPELTLDVLPKDPTLDLSVDRESVLECLLGMGTEVVTGLFSPSSSHQHQAGAGAPQQHQQAGAEPHHHQVNAGSHQHQAAPSQPQAPDPTHHQEPAGPDHYHHAAATPQKPDQSHPEVPTKSHHYHHHQAQPQVAQQPDQAHPSGPTQAPPTGPTHSHPDAPTPFHPKAPIQPHPEVPTLSQPSQPKVPIPSHLFHHDLYNGLSGILVFLSGLQRVLPSTHQVIGEACDRIAGALVTDRPRVVACGGAFSGAASDSYGLALAGVVADQPQWVVSAARLYDTEVTPASVTADVALDVVGGAAGCALVGLAVHDALRGLMVAKGQDSKGEERKGEESGVEEDLLGRVRDKAVLCGEHLLHHALRAEDGSVLGWPCTVLDNPAPPGLIQVGEPLPGMAHGIAGGVLALTRLHELTGDVRFLTCAQQAAAHEDVLLSRDTKAEIAIGATHGAHVHSQSDPNSWCWGLPGIALSRQGTCLKAVESVDDLATRLLDVDPRVPSLCCGASGRWDICLELFGSGKADAPNAARVEAALHKVLKEYARSGSTMFDARSGRLGLMQGISGMGYSLLRWLEPASFPCLLNLSGCVRPERSLRSN